MEKNWWDTTITYEQIVYNHLLTYQGFEYIPEIIVKFIAELLNINVDELNEYLEEKYKED